MEREYIENADLFKALSDPQRLMILDILSCGELCACKILENMDITQPTLSHHMKILSDRDLVNTRREGKWMHYSIKAEKVQMLVRILGSLVDNSKVEVDCSCR